MAMALEPKVTTLIGDAETDTKFTTLDVLGIGRCLTVINRADKLIRVQIAADWFLEFRGANRAITDLRIDSLELCICEEREFIGKWWIARYDIR
jgi:hypothetical protein